MAGRALGGADPCVRRRLRHDVGANARSRATCTIVVPSPGRSAPPSRSSDRTSAAFRLRRPPSGDVSSFRGATHQGVRSFRGGRITACPGWAVDSSVGRSAAPRAGRRNRQPHRVTGSDRAGTFAHHFGVTVPNDQPLSGYICGATSPMRFLSPSKESFPNDRRRQPFPVRPSRSGPVTPTSVRDRAAFRVLPGAAPWRWVMSAPAVSFPDGRWSAWPGNPATAAALAGSSEAGRRVTTRRRPPSQPQRWYRAHLGVVNRCPPGRRR